VRNDRGVGVFQYITTDPGEIRRDFARWPNANISIATGSESNIWVMEADTKEGHAVDGIASLAALEVKHGPLPPTLMAESPSGSLHCYFRWPQGREIRNTASGIAPGIDVRGEGGMVIAPPSVKVGVGIYRWLNDLPVADAPEWLIEAAIGAQGGGGGNGEREPSADPEADLELVAAAVAVIPNSARLKLLREIALNENETEDSDLDWEGFNYIGMATYRATGGRDFAIFDAWAQKSKKYVAATTIDKWHLYSKSPPNQISARTLFWLANRASPGWDNAYYVKIEEKMAAASKSDSESVRRMMDELRAKRGDTGDDTSKEEQPNEKEQLKQKEQPSDEQQQVGTKRSTAPVDLWAKFEPPPLPTHLLPTVIANFAIEQGELTGADPAGFAMAALTVCAAAIPDKIQVKVKRYGGWMESTRLWTALVGLSSYKKSPTIGTAVWPLRNIDIAMYRTYAEAKAKFDALPADQRRTTERPKQTRVLLEDVTVEAAQEVMRDSPDGVLCLHDELSGWFGGMDKYAGHRGAAKDRGFWLTAYNGGPYTFNRVARGSGLMTNLSASLLGGIQPEPMRKIATDTVDDGLLQRLIPLMMRPATLGKDAPIPGATIKYNDLVRSLHQLTGSFDELAFDDDAMEIRRRLEQRHLELTMLEAINKKLAAHIGKYDGIFARLCLLWHCIECVEKAEQSDMDPRIGKETAERVANFLHGFLLPHALTFYNDIFGLSDEHDRLTAVAGYILARGLKVVTNRDVQRGDRTMRNLKRRDVDGVFQQLNALGWLNRAPGYHMTDPPRWEVNPEVHLRFKERAKQEAERRRREREFITALLSGDVSQPSEPDSAF